MKCTISFKLIHYFLAPPPPIHSSFLLGPCLEDKGRKWTQDRHHCLLLAILISHEWNVCSDGLKFKNGLVCVKASTFSVTKKRTCDSILGIVISPYSFTSITSTHQTTSSSSQFSFLFLTFAITNTCSNQLQCFVFILVLAPLILNRSCYSGRYMGNTNGTIGSIDLQRKETKSMRDQAKSKD